MSEVLETYAAALGPPESALRDLAGTVSEGVPVALICFEGDSKRCHRHALLSELGERID